MNKLQQLLDETIGADMFYGTMSQKRDKSNAVQKIKFRKLILQKQTKIQFESVTDKQVFHENLMLDQAVVKIMECMTNQFYQMELQTEHQASHCMVHKNGSLNVKVKSQKTEVINPLQHNRDKKYIINEGTVVPFLVDLGVMTESGKIIQSKYDKFKQINRFLEMIRDIEDQLDKNKVNRIIDFGCGKSYLTFAMYYYLHELKGYSVEMVGLDLKADVIEHCNLVAKKYGYSLVKFQMGDISGYSEFDQVDMVVTLHACDTATDYALFKAIAWQAKIILSVPCCQHELNGQIHNTVLEPILDFGIIKERIAALMTDGLRAHLLKICGYKVQVVEFIDMAHTPKNIMLRAVFIGDDKQKDKLLQQYQLLKEQYHAELTLERLLKEANRL